MYGHVSAVIAEKGGAVYTTGSRATVRHAVREMNEHGIGALLVIDEGRALGIFTERDVLRRVVDAGRDPATTFVAEVMTPEVVTVTPGTPVRDAMELMTRRRCRHLPVVEGGSVVGMLSIGDLNRWASMTQEQEIQQLSDYIRGS